MTGFDRVLIDPDRGQLEHCLREAVSHANAGVEQGGVNWPLPGQDLFWRFQEGTTAGSRQWNGELGEKGRPVVVLAWWSDRLGRKHHRVVGRMIPFDRPSTWDLLCPYGAPRPPLWFVYPEHVFLKRDGGRRQALVLCACGAHGTPEELGWMGVRCDACHDRGEEGLPTQPAWLDPYRATLRGLEGRLWFVACSPDGEYLVGGSHRETLTVWRLSRGEEVLRLRAPENEWLLAAGWAADGRTILAGAASGRVFSWNREQPGPPKVFAAGGTAECFALAPGGAVLARADRHRISLWSATGQSRRELDSLPGTIVLAFSGSGTLLAGGSRSGEIIVWDALRGDVRCRLQQPGARVSCLAFSPDGSTLAVGLLPDPTDEEGMAPVLLVDTASGRVRATLAGHDAGVRCVAFAPDSRQLASGGDDGAVKLWDTVNGREWVGVEWHLDTVCAVAFTPDGLTLISGSFDGTAKLWPREVLRPMERRSARSVLVR
jgi:hypothetical protein